MPNNHNLLLTTTRKNNLSEFLTPFFNSSDIFWSLPDGSYTYDTVNPYTRTNDEQGNATYEFKLPGYKKGEVGVEVKNERLVITADSKTRGKTTFSVIDNVFDPNCIEAKLEDGILTVKVSKPERLKSKAIVVN